MEMIIFDDFFCFPAGSNQGEDKAFGEFLTANPEFKVVEWKSYFVTDIG